MKFPIRYKLIAIILTVLASALGFSVFHFFSIFKQEKADINARNLQIAIDIAKELDDIADRSQAILKTLAVDGGDAVRKFRENRDKIQLLLCDIIMPVKNGKDAYEEIRGIRHDLRVIFMSGYAADFIQSRGGIENGLEFVSKPVLPNELLKKVREVLDR